MTHGLNQAIAATVLGVFLLGIAAWTSINELSGQVDRWGAIEAVDAARQDLSRTIRQYRQSPDPEGQQRAIAAFDVLSAKIEALRFADPGNGFADDSGIIAADTLTAFIVAASQADTATRAMTNLDEALNQVAALVGHEAELARLDLAASTTASKELEDEQRIITERLHVLFGAMVTAEHIRRHIASFDRFKGTETGLEVPLKGIEAKLEQLPPPCTPEQEGETANICKPSTARLRASLAVLSEAGPDTINTLTQNAYWASEAYSRAAETRYRELTRQLQETVDKSEDERNRIRSLRTGDIAISRVNLALSEARAMAATLATTPLDDLETLNGQVRARIVQTRLRLPHVMTLRNQSEEEINRLRRLVAEAEETWSNAHAATFARRSAEQEYDALLNRLGTSITATTEEVRLSASHWISVFAKSTFAVLLLVAVAVIAAAFAANRHVARPLATVTSAILDLAQGATERRLVLKGGGAGFRRLAEAIERLRNANIERRELLLRNADQKAQIECQMKTLEKTNREIEHQARHDALTGLPNRRFAEDFLSEIDETSGRNGEDFALLHVDVDRFKEINDTIGHDAGDFILQHVSDVLRMRTGSGEHTFRIGGDEFLIAILGGPDKADVEAVASSIVEDLANPVSYEGHSCRIGASIGIAFGQGAGFDARKTLVNSDMALYRAKKAGRNQYAFFNDDLQHQMVRSRKMSDEILLGIERREFVPFYQPQFYCGSLALRGVEMLCRWQHPEHGLLSPGEFLPYADELKVTGRIDRILFERSANDLRALKARGILMPKISFNVTADRLMHQDLAESLRADIDPDTEVSIELLESMSLDTLSEALRWSIDTLKENDIRVEIDDFGSCRASIAGLISVGPDAMKVDRAIIAPITGSEPHYQLVKAIVEIGRALGIEVVAEGVETQDHVRLLTEIGCSVLQGFALARPMPVDDLAQFILKRYGAPGAAA
ncbi:bifunctional diguanylate cyclase/phosphodiesterase [Rhodovulum sp. P5]|uniref:putative bifunctional diguanylate cyclase/phosphodiesterase n=1 Tax=Rhodovulum sp. P5 TaxID=1564506 RepID=UPI00155FFCD0|nr:EAL domain-containing protein [Rhodovulum sp. P5]